MTLLPWSTIQNSLHTRQEVEGGYSQAHRGIITLPDGVKVFVKIGIDDNTKKWANREIEAYRILADCDYPDAPQLLAVNQDNTGFAIEALESGAGWDWTNNWTEARLTATLKAMDELAKLPLTAAQQAYFATGTIHEMQDGWRQLLDNKQSQQILTQKLRQAGRQDLADALDLPATAKQSATFKFTQDTLVHNDIRGDNCAWNPALNQVKIVDWNWAQLADLRIDNGAFLVNVHKTGMDIATSHADQLDITALYWLAGLWLNAAVQPLWPGASEKSSVRDHQLTSGITALDLISLLSNR